MSHVCPSWLSFVLYNPVRKYFTDREKILDESGITSDSVVLEIGPGSGFFTEVIAERAKEVFSVELQAGMVKKLKKRVGKFGDRVKILTGDIALNSVGDSYADVCLLYYSFHEIKDKSGAVNHIGKALKPGGLLSLYEPTVEVWKSDMEKTVKMFEDTGFIKEISDSNLFTRFSRLKKI